MPDWTDDEGAAATPPPPAEGLKRWWPLLLAVVLAAGLYAWLGRGGASGDVLHVGSQRGGTKALMLASGALDGAPYRVEWSEFPAAQTLLEAIGAGAVDVGMVGDAPFQFAYQSGSPIKAVAVQSATSRPRESLAILVPARSRIDDAGGLRGKRIATTRGSVGHYLLLRALDAKGLKPADVRLIFLAPGDAKAAFDTGSIDAWSIWSPYSGTALAEGARVVADGADYLSGYGFDAANASAATAKKAILTDYLQRESHALDWARAHPEDYAEVLAKETGLPLKIALFHARHLPMARVPLDDTVKAEERDVVAQFRKAGALTGDRPLDDAYLPLDQGAPLAR
ncbi:ABC transporter substrate-binding protein [Sphingomonas sp. Leaf208]|uniref:ABC transporter substrate-binding protein n=1 Tax=Sphingomonas sp. Leaf208 TaxID=1735679 RepID=UPI0009E8AAD0|nr:ABC transporter substrate-binding protein [Sphingomonas sp. Leaf208]